MKKLLHSIWILFLSTNFYSQTPVYQFNFDGNAVSTSGTVTLTTASISYGNDRNGQANKALYMGLSGSQAWANLTNVPLGNSPRTISIWFKANTGSSINIPLYSYGTDTNNNAILGYFFYDPMDTSVNGRVFGNSFGGTTNGLGYNIPLPFSGTAWHNYVFTYDGTTIKHYFDGALVASNSYSLVNTTGNQFNVGNYISNNPASMGWYDDLQIYNVALSDSQVSQVYSNNAVTPVTVPTISSVASTNITSNSSTINCDFYTNGGITTTTLYYGTSSSSLNLLSGSAGTTNHSTSISNRSFALNGLQPSTVYYYKVNASNSSGNVDSSVMSFITAASSGGSTITDGLIAYYGFEGNFNSHNNLHNLTASPNAPVINTTSGKVGAGANFVTSSNEGLVNSSSLNTVLTGNEFTICYWVQQQTVNSPGADYPSHFEMFGSGFVRNDGGGSDLNVGYGTSATTFKTGFANFVNSYNVWTHIAVVHKANLQEFEIYVNGVLTGTYISNSIPIPSLHKFSTNFHIGTGSTALKAFKGNIDEFYIYNRALTSSEIGVVKDNTNTSLASVGFNKDLNFNLYPNPTNDILNIKIDSEIKSVEIYSLQGQSIFTSTNTEINVSNLLKGIYLVKVEDVNGNIATKRLLKN